MTTVSEQQPSALRPSRAPQERAPRRPLRLRVHSLLRWLHVYISMVTLLLMLFFGVTGVTLNHPEWASSVTTEEASGELPAGWNADGAVDWLRVTEHLRAAHRVRGSLTDYGADEVEGSLAFRAPGYAADVFIDMETGGYQLTATLQGTLGLLNELHRGQDAARSWSWVIDVSGALLAVLGVTGLGLLFYLRKMRRSALITMAVGGAAAVALGLLTT